MRHDVERKMRSITDIELSGRKVFMRLDLNVPLKNGAITSDARIRAASPIITSDATVPAGYMGLDIGPKTRGAATVFWNGPNGGVRGGQLRGQHQHDSRGDGSQRGLHRAER